MGSIMMTRVMRGLKFWWFFIWTSLVGSSRIPQSPDILSPLAPSGLDVACARFVHIVHRTHCARFVPGSFANPPAGLPVLNPPLPCWWTRLHCWSSDGTQWTSGPVEHSEPVVRWSTVEDRVCPWFSSPIELAVMLGRHVPHSQEGINHICLKPTPKWSHGSHKRFNVGQQMYNAVGREAKYFRFR